MEPSISFMSCGFVSLAASGLGVLYAPKGLESGPRVGLISSSVLAHSRNLDRLALVHRPREGNWKLTRCAVDNVADSRFNVES